MPFVVAAMRAAVVAPCHLLLEVPLFLNKMLRLLQMAERAHHIMMDQVRVVPVVQFVLRLQAFQTLVRLKPRVAMHRVMPVWQEQEVAVVLLFSQKE